MESVRFSGTIRYWNPDKGSGLAVIDVPVDDVQALGGLKQQHVRGRFGGEEFASNIMPAGGGRLAMSVSKVLMSAARVTIGEEVEGEITTVGSD